MEYVCFIFKEVKSIVPDVKFPCVLMDAREYTTSDSRKLNSQSVFLHHVMRNWMWQVYALLSYFFFNVNDLLDWWFCWYWDWVACMNACYCLVRIVFMFDFIKIEYFWKVDAFEWFKISWENIISDLENDKSFSDLEKLCFV